MTRAGSVGIRRLPIALVFALVLCASTSSAAAILRQEEPASAVEIGAGPIREPSLALVGRAIYGADSVAVFGYFTALKALDPALLFATTPSSESTARFTYAGEIGVTSRADRGDVTSISGEGTIRVFLDDAGGATWDDPASFADGQELAAWSVLLRETLHRQGPGAGLVVGDDRLTQFSSEEFTLADESYKFGDTGIAQRLRTVGAIIIVDPAQSVLTVSLSGSGAVSERSLTPVQLGLSATPAAAQVDACSELEQWMSETLARLARAQEVAAAPEVAGAIDDVDVDAVRAAADEVTTLAGAQRAATVPVGGEEASRLVVTSLSTYARGLQSVKDGAAAGDAELVAQGQSVIGDGERLGERALQALDVLGASCPATG
jgi:hypothetical protein